MLSAGGLMAGHDYSESTPWRAVHDKQAGGGLRLHRTPVAEAVRDFLRGRGEEPHRPTLFVTADHPASWFVFKPCDTEITD